jgi:hypothetical protein
MVLSAGSPEASDGGAHDRDGLFVPCALAIGAGGGVDGVLEHAGDGVVVLGGNKENGVGSANGFLELDYPGCGLSFVILIKGRNSGDVESIDFDVIRREQLGGPECPLVV